LVAAIDGFLVRRAIVKPAITWGTAAQLKVQIEKGAVFDVAIITAGPPVVHQILDWPS
jgi:hypothetical protein